MKRISSTLVSLSLLLCLTACDKENAGESEGTDESSDKADEGEPPVPTPSGGDDATSTTGDGSVDDSETTGPDESETDESESEDTGPPPPACGPECSLFDDMCAEGERCAPYVCEPGSFSWDKDVCIPAGPRQTGETCKPPFIGTHDESCDRGNMCWGGKCNPLCEGSVDDPTCARPGELCLIGNEGVLAVCLPECDPFAVDCEGDNTVCLPGGENPKGFVCVGGGPAPGESGNHGSACQYLNGCEPGHLCMEPGQVDAPGCNDGGCCSPFCDIQKEMDEGGQCPGENEICAPVFENEIPGYEHVGICTIPAR